MFELWETDRRRYEVPRSLWRRFWDWLRWRGPDTFEDPGEPRKLGVFPTMAALVRHADRVGLADFSVKDERGACLTYVPAPEREEPALVA